MTKYRATTNMLQVQAGLDNSYVVVTKYVDNSYAAGVGLGFEGRVVVCWSVNE